MGDIFGKGNTPGTSASSSSSPGGGTFLFGGGSGAPFSFGPSPFDVSAISDAVGQNTSSVDARYNQLGLGGSTMEGQDVGNAEAMGTALTGQEQQTDVTNPAINEALQPPASSLIGAKSSSGSGTGSVGSTLGSLAALAGGSALGSSAAGSVGTSALIDEAAPFLGL